MDTPNKKTQKEISDSLTPLNFIVIVLSIYVLIALAIDTFFVLPIEVSKVLLYADDLICIVFLTDFCVHLYKAESKLEYLKWGWIDLLSSIPMFHYLRPGRTLRLIRLFRILRAFRSTRHLVNHIYKKRTQGAFTTVFIIAI